jgi:hypothetical protein
MSNLPKDMLLCSADLHKFTQVFDVAFNVHKMIVLTHPFRKALQSLPVSAAAC